MSWKLAIFDWDGVLFDSIWLAHKCNIIICQLYKIKLLSFEKWREIGFRDYMDYYRYCGLPPSVKRKEILGIFDKYFDTHKEEIKLSRGAKALLRFCQKNNLKTAIVSAGSKTAIQKVLREKKIDVFIDIVKGDARPTKKKKLREVLNYFCCLPSQAFFVDDRVDNIITAKKMGLATIGYCGKEAFQPESKIVEAHPDFCVKKLSQLKTIIEKNL